MGTQREMNPVSAGNMSALLNPRLAVLVTCMNEQGLANIITIAWHTHLSHQPPLVGISIGKARYSHDLVAKSKEFAINVMGMDRRDAVLLCGSRSGSDCDKAALAGLTLRDAHVIQTPVIAEALGSMECRLQAQYEVGDHTFFVGEVVYAEAAPDCFTDAWELDQAKVLLYVRGEKFVTIHP